MLVQLLRDPESDLRFIPTFEMYFPPSRETIEKLESREGENKPRMTDLGTASPLSFENYFSPTIIPKGNSIHTTKPTGT